MVWWGKLEFGIWFDTLTFCFDTLSPDFSFLHFFHLISNIFIQFHLKFVVVLVVFFLLIILVNFCCVWETLNNNKFWSSSLQSSQFSISRVSRVLRRFFFYFSSIMFRSSWSLTVFSKTLFCMGSIVVSMRKIAGNSSFVQLAPAAALCFV